MVDQEHAIGLLAGKVASLSDFQQKQTGLDSALMQFMDATYERMNAQTAMMEKLMEEINATNEAVDRLNKQLEAMRKT